ncbi:MAG: hypothetical protein ACR2OF_07280 [Hyphomicrobium sp.]
MILIIAGMIALTIAVAFWLAAQFTAERVHFQATPDRPCAFCHSMAWLAIRSHDTEAVLEALGVTNPAPCNWNSGIGSVYDNQLGEMHVFVSPPVDNWTFVVGLPLPHPFGRGFVDKCTPLLVDLGGQFPQVQYFFAYPLIDFFAWARVGDGRLVRAFAITDEGIAWSKGRPTKEERSLGLKLFELRGVRGRKGDAGGEMILHPTEDHVMRLAHRWSLDPTTLSSLQSQQPALGYIAEAPHAWRTERIRKADRPRQIA